MQQLRQKQATLNFLMNNALEYGKALYVVGNIQQLGNWQIKSAIRMSWNQGNQWKASVVIKGVSETTKIVEYKYVIADWNFPDHAQVRWEIGEHNRKIKIYSGKQAYQCENCWNRDKITLNLLLEKPFDHERQRYCIIGSIKELGKWKQPQLMRRVDKDFYESEFDGCFQGRYDEILQFSFLIYRSKTKFHYYYIKKTQQFTIQRHPGRKYYLQTAQKTHPKCLRVEHLSGGPHIFEECNFNELVYSKITSRIFLGAYLKNSEDLGTLKKQGVNCVLSIQSEQDFDSHSLNEVFLKYLCHKNNVEFCSYSILDMNKRDFIERSYGALQIMRDIMSDKENVVYVHCSAGAYRSAQVVVLYLTLIDQFEVADAIEFVKERHPVARPNRKIVEEAIKYMSNKR